MPDKKFEQTTSTTIDAIGRYIKSKIPTVDQTVSQDSAHAVSAAGVYAYVQDTIKELGGISFKIVESLPESGEGNIIYLVPKTSAETDDVYDEYIWQNSKWERIGSTAVDMSGYVKAEQMVALTKDDVDDILNVVWGDT